jgi:hypothetical protein
VLEVRKTKMRVKGITLENEKRNFTQHKYNPGWVILAQ